MTEDATKSKDAETKDDGSNNSGDPKTGEGADNSTPDKEELRALIKEEIAAALAGNGTKPSDDSKDDKERTVPRRADVEKMAEEMVQKAAAKFAHDKEHEELSKLKEPPKHEQHETAPKKVRRLTKAIWGDDD